MGEILEAIPLGDKIYGLHGPQPTYQYQNEAVLAKTVKHAIKDWNNLQKKWEGKSRVKSEEMWKTDNKGKSRKGKKITIERGKAK